MSKETVRTKIIGVGYYVPPKVVTNEDWSKLVDTNDEWIVTRTGIKERRMAEPGVASSDLGKIAAENALENAGMSADQIDLIICATISPDKIFPSTACIIQEKIGAKNAAAFDISAACSGFPFALTIADQFIKTGLYKYILVISAETLTHLVDKQDRSTCVLFGDGSGAAIVTQSTDESGVLGTFMKSDGSYENTLHMPAGGSRLPASHETVDARLHYLTMEGKDVFKTAVYMMRSAAEEALSAAGLTVDDVDLFIPHQANIRIIKAIFTRLKVPDERVLINVDKYGNTSSATTIIGLAEAVEQGRIKKGSIVVLTAFGAGFTWGATVIRW